MKLMQPTKGKITPCLWFDSQAEEAARFYTGLFPNSAIKAIHHFGEAGREIHGRPAGSVMTVAFELDGQPFTALNGGPTFKFTDAISLQVDCESQADIDYYWEHLTQGGDPAAQQCGWLKDKFGLSWQIIPAILSGLLSSPDASKSERVLQSLLGMKKLDIATLRQAWAG